jgi:acetyl-CoA acetyltransferase
MSRAPVVMLKPERAFPRGAPEIADSALGWRFVNPRMAERYSTEAMGETAENLAEVYRISREAQDKFALRSHQKAVSATQRGIFEDELVPPPP